MVDSRSRASHKSRVRNKRAEDPATEEIPIERVASIAYGPKLGEVDISQDGFNTEAKVAGRKYISSSRVTRG